MLPGATVCDGVDELTVKLGAGLPVPFSVTVCGEPLALSVTETVAVKLTDSVLEFGSSIHYHIEHTWFMPDKNGLSWQTERGEYHP